jgi:diguanylate cyclase (GGDEF)-like protein
MKTENVLSLLDCFAFLWIASTLYSFRRKKVLNFLSVWSLGLGFLATEEAARFFYYLPAPAVLHGLFHAISLDSYLFAGLLFLHTSLGKDRLAPRQILYISLCGVLPLIVLSAYGMGAQSRFFFLAAAIIGLAASLLLTAFLRRPKIHLLYHAVMWLPCIGFAHESLFRHVSYYLLFSLYMAIAIGFSATLPRDRMGRGILVVGFGVLSYCFLSHPWVRGSDWEVVADRLWDTQMLILTFGLAFLSQEELAAAHEYDALHDALTGLPNRRLFSDYVEKALASAQRNRTRAVLFCLDLDAFKSINDTLGHEAGDFLLREVAKRLQSLTRGSDVLCRIGGDEFYLLVDDLAVHGASDFESYCRLSAELLHELRMRVEAEPYLYGSGGRQVELKATFSAGCAIYPDQASTMADLCRAADKSMYEEKARRGNHALN